MRTEEYTAEELFRQLNETDESESLEAKALSRDTTRSIMETVCSFSNEPGLGGGVILLGVAENDGAGPRYVVENIEDVDKTLIFLREAGAVNNLVFRQLSGVDTLHASSALREMRDEGIIVQKGAGNATYYVPGEIIFQREDETLQDDGKRLLDNETRLLDNEAGLLDNEARLLDNERIEIALKPLKKRLKPAVLDQIVSICAKSGDLND